MANKTIEEVVKNDLCTGCGTCVTLCPNSAIYLIKDNSKGVYIPKLNEEKCNQCGTCFDVCPGHSVDYKQLNLAMFDKESENILIGNYINCYTGHAANQDIRYNSASGGLVTALLIFALEEGIIDGALVTKMNDTNPLEPEVFIARTKEEIISASKSKYCPVPANIGLKEILSEDGKFAVVGLPCHINGIRNAETINNKLKEKIILHIGIFCGRSINFLGTEFLLHQMNIKKEDVKKIDYRGEGWPGKMLIKLKNGEERFVSYLKYWDNGFGLYFPPTRCTLCCDGTCELSDISFGDTWLPEFRNEKIGESIIISRTKLGEEIIENAKSKRKIELIEIKDDKVVKSQERMLYTKKSDLKARISIFKIFGKKTPNYNIKLLKPESTAYLNAISLYLQLCISSKRCLWSLIHIYIFLKPYTVGVLKRLASYCLNNVRKILR